MKYLGNFEFWMPLLVCTVIVGCAEKVEDHEIGSIIEKVLGHEIPENYQVVQRKNPDWFNLAQATEYEIVYEEKDYKDLVSRLDPSKWTKSYEVLDFDSSLPHETVQLIPSDKRLSYVFFLGQNE